MGDGLPKDLCPDSLKAHMNSAAGKGVVDDSIFIDCRGRNVADQEALAGKITYFPASRALPIKYFPYLGQRNQVDKEVGYHSPLVAIQVDPATKGQLVHGVPRLLPRRQARQEGQAWSRSIRSSSPVRKEALSNYKSNSGRLRLV